MRIAGFQKLTLLDFPGSMACIVFTQGCNFRCPFCHNAELVLPQGAAGGVGEPSMMPAEDVLSYLEQRKNLLEGVVVSGGEPLLQPDLEEFLGKVHELGYRIKLDTNGSIPGRLRSLLEQGLADYVAMDLKQAPDRYYSAAHVPETVFQLVAESLQVLQASGVPFEIRTTLVKGIHTKEDLTAMAQWLGAPVHWYLQSYVDSGHVIDPQGLSAFSQEELEELLAAARVYCPSTELRV